MYLNPENLLSLKRNFNQEMYLNLKRKLSSLTRTSSRRCVSLSLRPSFATNATGICPFSEWTREPVLTLLWTSKSLARLAST